MAGYIFGLDSLDSLNLYTKNGVYGTKLSVPLHSWRAPHEGTFADYATMRPGDNLYFFIQRRIYGIHADIARRLPPENELRFGMPKVLSSCADGNRLRHEMAIEAGILQQLSIADVNTREVLVVA